MKSPKPHQTIPSLSTAPGLFRLRTAGLADPSNPALDATDAILEIRPPRPQVADALAPPFRILAIGREHEIDAHPAAQNAAEIDTRGAVVCPAFANAHTHLDLTHFGPIPHDPDEGFVAWVDRVRAGRAQSPDAIAASVRRGIELSLRAGVVLVGDIAGAPRGVPSLTPYRTLAESPLASVSYLEFFAIGSGEAAALERLEATLADAERDRGIANSGDARVRLGLQPHATNTVSLTAYCRAVDLAARYALPLATHLAETPEEREFIAHGTGPQREMLERFGLWDGEMLKHVGQGLSPVAHLAPVLSRAPFLCAHVNDLGPEPESALQILAEAGASVAYCPRAGDYFAAPDRLGPHRYRDMLAAGINVCLGTDSILNLPPGTDDETGPGLSVLDETRLLFKRDGTDPHALLRMCTTNTARALGVDEAAFSFSARADTPAAPFGLVLIDARDTDPTAHPFERALRSDAPPQLIALSTTPV